MKSLFDSALVIWTAVMLTVAVCADQYLYPPVWYSSLPSSESVMIVYDAPVYGVPLPYPVSNSIVNTSYAVVLPTEKNVAMPLFTPLPPLQEPFQDSLPHIAAKPTEMVSAVPSPISPLFSPSEEPLAKEEEMATIRGQGLSVDALGAILNVPPPIPQGTVDEETIDQKLTAIVSESELGSSDLAGIPAPSSSQADTSKTKQTDPLGYGVLLAAIAVTTACLIYMVFVAYDYRQRWMQSLTMQNDRHLGGGAFDMTMFDLEKDDAYRDYLAGTPAY